MMIGIMNIVLDKNTKSISGKKKTERKGKKLSISKSAALFNQSMKMNYWFKNETQNQEHLHFTE